MATWSILPVFKWLKDTGNISGSEMGRTFNVGVGMVAVVDKKDMTQFISELEASGETVYVIGNLVARRSEGCILQNLSSWE